MATKNFSKHFIASIVCLLLGLGTAACKPQGSKGGVTLQAQARNEKFIRAGKVLSTVGVIAENSFYACMANAHAQGLPREQIAELCATKLLEDDGKGFGDGPMGDVMHPELFDPNAIVAACTAGDPTHSQAAGSALTPRYGSYSWGGDAQTSYQYTKEESEKLKNEAIAKAEAESAKFADLEAKADQAKKDLDAAKASGNAAEIKKAEQALKDAHKQANDQAGKASGAMQNALADPNQKPPSVSHAVQDSACTQALDSARELLRECHRTNWQDFRCQELNAKMHGCPDPALILVDPEQGYSCGASPDPEAVKDAWVAQCEQRVRYGPGGSNPCEPPKLEGMGRVGSGRIGDVCSDPYAYLNPDNNDCIATLAVSNFGQPDITQIIVIGLNKIGGPIVVLPPSRGPRPPRPGPEPRPGPR